MTAEIFEDVESLYNDGYDDGYNGHIKKSGHPSYLEGYYDGQEEAEAEDDWSAYDYDFFSDGDDED